MTGFDDDLPPGASGASPRKESESCDKRSNHTTDGDFVATRRHMNMTSLGWRHLKARLERYE